MQNVINRITKFSEFSLILYSLILSAGMLFFLYFLVYLFFTNSSYILIIGIFEGIFAAIALYFLFKMTKNE